MRTKDRRSLSRLLSPESKIGRAGAFASIAAALCIVGVLALGGSMFSYWWALHRNGISLRSEDWGSFGAYVSGIAGSAIALTTLIALALTFSVQARELERSRNAVLRQIFDSTFFQLLHRFSEIVSSLGATRWIPEDDSEQHLTGRSAIEVIYKSMTSQYPVTPVDDARATIVEMHRYIYGIYEWELGPYFRTLYHVFKFIDSRDYLSDREKVDYTSIARAQLSRFELALLFYNCLTPYGEGFKPLIEKYGILKHVNPADLADSRHKTNPSLYRSTAFMSQAERERAVAAA